MAKSNEKDLDKKEKVPEKAPDKAQKPDKNAKPNVFVRMRRRLKETFSELKRVTWPTLPKALKATGVVIVIVLVFMVIVTGVNYGFGEILRVLTEINQPGA